MALFVKKCPCLRPKIEEDIRTLDYRHCSLSDVPGEVFNCERTLEELLVDSNQIQELPRELFYCHGIRKLSLSDNEVKQIPPAIGHLISLESIDLSKNGVIDIPENIKNCKHLQIVDASVNPLGKLPDGFTQLLNLTQLYLNDTFLDYLPGNFGRLSKLKILEIRENHLKTLPNSFSRLNELEKLDIGHNEFTELPDVIGSLSSLLELWCDHNQITTITPTIGNLKQLMFFDGCKNCLTSLPHEIEGCTSLADLHLTTNQIQVLPDTIGNLGNLTTLKVDDNCLTGLPGSVGGLGSLSELNVSANALTELPSSLGLLRYLRTLYADDNDLTFVPAELGSCSGITVLSLRSNKMTYIPDEIGRIPRLRVLNLSSNQLRHLPFTFVKLKELQALWLSENQHRPLIPLQSEHEPDTGRKILTCYLLPQGPPQDSGDPGGDTDSFHASMWDEERRNRQLIHFEFGDDSDVDGSLIRQPTPYPKEMREKARHIKNLALRQQISNGNVVRSKGEDNLAYDKSPSMERVSGLEGDGRVLKPSSPSLHDSHSLFKHNKEKEARDKARMHHHQESEDERRSPRKHGSRDNSPAASDRGSRRSKDKKWQQHDDEGGFNEPRVTSLGSTPDIPSAVDDRSGSIGRQRYNAAVEHSNSFSNRPDHRMHHGSYGYQRSQRSRKMRDYDSDTGYRSDQEVLKFRRQQQQMFQRNSNNYGEIVPVASRSQRKDGYCSDLESYSRRGFGYHDPSQNDNHSNSSQEGSQGHRSFGTARSPSKSNIAVKNDELYEHNPMHYPSPSPLQSRNITDQSTPLLENQQRNNEHGRRQELFPLAGQMADVSLSDRENKYMPNTPSRGDGSNASSRPVPPYKPAPPYGIPVQRQLPPTPNRTSPYGVSLYDSRPRSSPVKDYHHQRMPEIQECRDSASDLSRSRSQLQYQNNAEFPSSPDYRLSDQSNMDLQNSSTESAQTLMSRRANVSSRSFQGQGHHQGDVTSASSKDSGNSSYYDRTSGESPVDIRNSPLSVFRDRKNSRGSPYHSDPRNTYDHYREPPTVDIPTHFDDIAMYKNEPPSQVSSSTDSGYGHNVFDRMLETQRLSGNHKGSPSPDQFNSDSNCTSSSHQEMAGQYSRGTTPVNHNDSRETTDQCSRMERLCVTITKSPGLGFSIAGGIGSYGNPFKPNDLGIFVTKVQPGGPAATSVRPGDKLLKVNGVDFRKIEHDTAVNTLKTTGNIVQLQLEREVTPS